MKALLTRALMAGLLAAASAAAGAVALEVQTGGPGLRQVTVDGVRMLAPGGGDVRAINRTPRIVAPDGASTVATGRAEVSNPAPRRFVRTYPWGTVDCEYAVGDDRIVFTLAVTNASRTDTIAALDLRLVELMFAAIPDGRIADAGMFGTGGQWRPLGAAPLAADPAQMPPAIFVRNEASLVVFAADEQEDAPRPSIPFSTSMSKLNYPLVASFAGIAPQAVARARLSVRFGGVEAEDELVADVYERFREKYPYLLDWPDRRPIGALWLATSEAHPAKNPRGWFGNAADVDTTTPEGLARWRERLLRYADGAIRILRDLDAQAMITWDPEGEQYRNATYYGDPRLASRLAPETDYLGALDEYFRKFREAGIATGIAIRPQAIAFDDQGIPRQRFADDPREELLGKIEYARARWGCTIFYVDSTYDAAGALDADVFRRILEIHPDILMLPENETFRSFAYGAPLNSFQHQNVTGTPRIVRKVYRRAFSALLATVSNEAQQKAGREALVESVRQGDVLVVFAGMPGNHVEFVKSIYREAAR